MAAEAGADILMFDNMTPAQVTAAIETLRDRGLTDRLQIEISGGIDEGNLLSYALPGVDLISAGMLTHSVKNLDISLDIVPENPKHP